MADSKTPAAEPAAGAAPASSPASSTSPPSSTAASSTTKPPSPPKPPAGNPALRMLGLPNLPRKLPSRNWMIFWAVTGAFTAAVVYDKREKKRATAKWRQAVAPLALEPIHSPNQLPRKLTIYMEAPPGDGLRAAQDHFLEYVKPVLSSSGLDWEFVQGRQQGDVRAAVAEKIRRSRSASERPGDELAKTDDTILEDMRKKMGLPDYEGVRGDIVIGRHTWKEYMRGLHEGWLGPLDAPPQPIVEAPPQPPSEGDKQDDNGEAKKDDKPEEKKEDEKPKRPPQPVPYNTTDDYSSASIPMHIPTEFSPSTIIAFPHRLGFSHTFVRLGRFFNRRKLADSIGRDVAAVCFAASREWREADGQYEQQITMQHEENDWPKKTWKDDSKPEDDDDNQTKVAAPGTPPKEKIWISPVVVDSRIVQRMRRFELQPDDEERASRIVVPETEIEGWIKGSLRSVWQWGASSFESKPRGPNIGNVDDE